MYIYILNVKVFLKKCEWFKCELKHDVIYWIDEKFELIGDEYSHVS